MNLNINIYQGNDREISREADINVVIDVLRAFTVAHIAFVNGVEKIVLINDVEKAFQLKKQNKELILAGEIAGVKINGFDLDNSPWLASKKDLTNKTIVQKTTNGVKATLNALNAEKIIVTGFTNADNTVNYIKKYLQSKKIQSSTINIIASHPTSDEDLACADYIKSELLNRKNVTKAMAIERILCSENAKKFIDKNNDQFLEEDLKMCVCEISSTFVMLVNKKEPIPALERFEL